MKELIFKYKHSRASNFPNDVDDVSAVDGSCITKRQKRMAQYCRFATIARFAVSYLRLQGCEESTVKWSMIVFMCFYVDSITL